MVKVYDQHGTLIDPGLPAIPRPQFPYVYSDPTLRNVTVYQKFGDTTTSTDNGLVMPYSGSILAHTVSLEITVATSGNVRMQIHINDSVQSEFNLQFTSAGGTGWKTGRVNLAPRRIKFVEDDLIQVTATLSLGGAMRWQNVIGSLVLDTEG